MITHSGRRRWRTALMVVCWIVVGLLWCGNPATAAEGGHGVTDTQKMDLLYRIINFTLLVIVLVVVVRKTAVRSFFSARREDIEQRFKQLKADRDAATKRYAELESKLKDFEAEKAMILDQFMAEGAKEKQRIIAEARERAAQILAQADLTIEREIQEARDLLRREVVDVAADRAGAMIARNFKDSDQDHLVMEFIEKVEKLN